MLWAFGLSHHTAALALRERLAFVSEELRSSLPELCRAVGGEAAILSTCNRTELYIAGERAQAAPLWLCERRGIRPQEMLPALYRLQDERAVRHAFRVAAGLDSMVLGEPQILGQMKAAAREAAACGTLGTVLHRLFQSAFALAKDVRTGTGIGEGTISLAAAAVRLALRIFPSLREQAVLFVGAGEMIELCATHFASHRPARLTVANRSLARAQALAARWGGDGQELRRLPEILHAYDVVVSCTASSLPIIGKGLLERALRLRRRRPVLLIDLAVPRDVEPEVRDLPDAFLYTLDDLQGLVTEGREHRKASLVQAEALVEAEVGRFMRWMQARESVPVVRAMRERAEIVRRREVERGLRRLGSGEAPAAVLESLSHRLAAKLLHAPSRALNDADPAERPALTRAAKTLFGLG